MLDRSMEKIRFFENHVRDPHVRGQVELLKELMQDHRYSMPGPWKKAAENLNKIKLQPENLDQFIDFANVPFTSREVFGDLKQFIQKVHSGDIVIPGLKNPKDLLAVGLRGTGGASIGQIVDRARFVTSVFDGDIGNGSVLHARSASATR